MKTIMQICCLSNPQSFTAKIFFTFFSLWIPQLALAQFQDDFSDNNFTASPEWMGDDSHFQVTDDFLKLNAPKEEGVSYLSTTSLVTHQASWEFKVFMEFNPSGTNYARVYLISDRDHLAEPLNGYFIMIGDSKDEVSLYKQTGISYSKIIDGRDGILNLATVEVRIKVVRDEKGVWQLFTALGMEEYTLEGSAEDMEVSLSTYFGILCAYTATRSDKFSFDDFNIQGTPIPDELPPTLKNIDVISSNVINLTFSEVLDQESATNIENYVVNPVVGNPKSAALEPDQKTVLLTFENPFSENSYSGLTISGVADLSGNVMPEIQTDFIFIPTLQPKPKDIIISELFADPSPSVGLPETEFVELYNRSEKTFNLAGWKFTDQSSIATLPDFVLLPKEYVILTSQSSTPFPSDKKLLSLLNFPALNNAGDVLILKDDKGITIDSIQYFETWYKDDDKSKGGWSLEIIDPENTCSVHENWIASEDTQGGTPGFQNSVLANKPDLTGPKLRYAIPTNASTIELKFDEKLEKQLPPITSFTINPSIPIGKVAFINPAFPELQLILTQEIQTGLTYTIEIAKLNDCAGNPIQAEFSKAEFGLPEPADSLDVLVNEILFNPRPTGVDFVEMVNNSSKYFNLKNWSIGNVEDGTVTGKVSLTSEDFLFKPGGLLVLTSNANVLKGEYLLSHEENFLVMKNFPRFNDDAGAVGIVDPDGRMIDFFVYTKDMHSIFIKDDEGVSLERIALYPTTTTQNWKSASASVGFATPGYLNSNSVQPSENSEAVKVEPEIFNPLGVHPNFALIRYTFEHGGNVANVKVFDSQGHLIKDLANNDILGTTGFYRWDGDRNDGTKARVGYYMIWFEIFDEQGVVKKFQQRVAIATAF
jgi:hypothetical protein